MRLQLLISCSIALLSWACSTPTRETPSDNASTKRAPPAPRALWTKTFLEDAVLSAEEVRVEGPPELLEHIVVVQDADNHEYVERTLPEGLLIRAELKPDGTGNAIRAQLDQLTITADRVLLVLVRPAAVPVSVDARGDVYHCLVATRAEKRAPTMRLVGEPAP